MRCTLLTRWNIVLAVDIMHGYGPNNKIRPRLQPKKVVLVVSIAAKDVICALHY